jgi:hypothetical protein
MAYFAPDVVCYMDATLGWDFDSYAALKAVFEQYMPTWAPPARSYAAKILAGEESALVHMVDTPELFGGELRILAAIDFADGKIVRWVDYWDSTAYDTGLYHQFRTPADPVPHGPGRRTGQEPSRSRADQGGDLPAPGIRRRGPGNGSRRDAHRRRARGHGFAHPGDRPHRGDTVSGTRRPTSWPRSGLTGARPWCR